MAFDERGQKRILVVSGDGFACQLIQKILAKRFDFEMTRTDCCGDAVAEALTGKYIGAIIDLVLPSSSARKLIKTIKTMLPGLPIMIMTSDSSDEALKLIRNLGILNIIPKPFKMHALIEGIISLTGAGQAASSRTQA